MIVLDASAALELLLNTARASKVGGRVFRPGESIHAPHLIDVEIAQVLRRLRRRREISESRANQVLQDLADLPMVRYSHLLLLPGIWSLRDNVSAYDACYLSLARALDALLVTCDAALAAVPGYTQRVAVIE